MQSHIIFIWKFSNICTFTKLAGHMHATSVITHSCRFITRCAVFTNPWTFGALSIWNICSITAHYNKPTIEFIHEHIGCTIEFSTTINYINQTMISQKLVSIIELWGHTIISYFFCWFNFFKMNGNLPLYM